MQLARVGDGNGEAFPALFENEKKCSDFRKVLIWVKFSIQNKVLRVSRRKNFKMFSCGVSFSCAFDEMLIKVSQFHTPSPIIFSIIKAYSHILRHY